MGYSKLTCLVSTGNIGKRNILSKIADQLLKSASARIPKVPTPNVMALTLFDKLGSAVQSSLYNAHQYPLYCLPANSATVHF